MKTICLYFEIHQNVHLKRYRFFEIGKDHYYFDDYENERGITETAERSYIPAIPRGYRDATGTQRDWLRGIPRRAL